MAGHSKWANIKHRKERQDAKKGKIFTRLAKELTIAAREGGGDPDMNPRLRLAIQKAKDNSMPNDNINRAIKKGTGELEGQNLEEIRYEGYGPNGIAVIVETITDNKNRTVADVRSTFSKMGGNLGETNSVAWNFDRMGVIVVETKDAEEEDLLLEVLEAGAEDLEFSEDTSRILCAMEEFQNVTSYFEDNDVFKVKESQLEYIPKNKTTIEDVSEAKKILKFLDAIEDLDDVQNIYNNAEIPDEVVEQIEE